MTCTEAWGLPAKSMQTEHLSDSCMCCLHAEQCPPALLLMQISQSCKVPI